MSVVPSTMGKTRASRSSRSAREPRRVASTPPTSIPSDAIRTAAWEANSFAAEAASSNGWPASFCRAASVTSALAAATST